MTCPCIQCANLDLKSDERMAKEGFSRCKKFSPECYVSVYREIECQHYRKAESGVIEKRIEWRNKREACKKNRR